MNDTAVIDARLFRSTMGRFATGVTVVTAFHDDGHPHAMTVNAFLSVSLDPPLVLVSLNNRSRMNAHLHLGGRYGINVLAASQEEHSRHFGGRSVEGLEVNWLPHLDTDAPLLDGCVAQWLPELSIFTLLAIIHSTWVMSSICATGNGVLCSLLWEI